MKFNLEEQYQIYLQKVDLDENKMGETQKKETRQAFFAGVSQSVLFYLALANIEEMKAVDLLDDLIMEVSNFWLKLTGTPLKSDN